jgi:hypothetical protein
MVEDPVDIETWRTFELAAVKRFAWDACREVLLNGSYSDPWTFRGFLTASKRKAYKSHDKTTVDSFFNNNNTYRVVKGDFNKLIVDIEHREAEKYRIVK